MMDYKKRKLIMTLNLFVLIAKVGWKWLFNTIWSTKRKNWKFNKYDGVFLKSSIKNFDFSEIYSKIKNINPKIEIFNSYVFIKNINQFNLSDKFIIFSGIGNAYSFKDTLINNNFNITKEIIFPDHHEYKLEEISKILNFAKKEKAEILTTEKDYVKIPENLKDKINYIEIDLKIEEKDKLINLIKTKINETY